MHVNTLKIGIDMKTKCFCIKRTIRCTKYAPKVKAAAFVIRRTRIIWSYTVTKSSKILKIEMKSFVLQQISKFLVWGTQMKVQKIKCMKKIFE